MSFRRLSRALYIPPPPFKPGDRQALLDELLRHNLVSFTAVLKFSIFSLLPLSLALIFILFMIHPLHPLSNRVVYIITTLSTSTFLAYPTCPELIIWSSFNVFPHIFPSAHSSHLVSHDLFAC